MAIKKQESEKDAGKSKVASKGAPADAGLKQVTPVEKKAAPAKAVTKDAPLKDGGEKQPVNKPAASHKSETVQKNESMKKVTADTNKIETKAATAPVAKKAPATAKAAEPEAHAEPVKPEKKPVAAKKAEAEVKPEPARKVVAEESEPTPAPPKPVEKPAKKPAVPVKKVLSASSLDKRVLAAKAASAVVTKPMATPAARPTEKKPQVIIAHRKLENKSKDPKEEEAAPPYQPEVYRSLLDEPSTKAITVYRYNDEELAEFKELINSRLEAARKEMIYLQGVITRKDEAGTEDTENRYMNMEDGSGAMEREQLAQLASRQIQFVGHLEKALVRIENKTYGVCRVTGKLIEKARLRAVPHATLSIEAKKMMNTKNN